MCAGVCWCVHACASTHVYMQSLCVKQIYHSNDHQQHGMLMVGIPFFTGHSNIILAWKNTHHTSELNHIELQLYRTLELFSWK